MDQILSRLFLKSRMFKGLGISGDESRGKSSILSIEWTIWTLMLESL